MKKLYALFFSVQLCNLIYGQTTISTYPTLAANNGSSAVTFELVTTKAIEITSLTCAFSVANSKEIYYRPGGVLHGTATTPGIPGNGWVLHETVLPTITNGTLIPSPINLTTPLVLQPGTYGFCINSPGGSLRYRSWVATDPSAFTNGTVTINAGVGYGFGGTLTGWIASRAFVGSLTYDLVVYVPNDAGVTEITQPATGPCGGGNTNVAVTIKNFGTNQINPVTVNWSVNGVLRTPVIHSSFLDTVNGLGSSTALVALGVANISATTEIKAWTSMPNNTADTIYKNDTAIAFRTPPLNGVYTINPFGSGSTNFLSFVDAANALSSYGVCGPVTFNVSNATYSGRVKIDNIVGASTTNTVTFNGNGATITAAPDATNPCVVQLNGAKFVTLDSLNIIGTDLTYGIGIMLTNEANYNTINACNINLTAVTSTSSTTNGGIVASGSASSPSTAGNTASFCNITNNLIKGGATGLYYGIRLNGNTGNVGCVGNLIQNNSIEDIYIYNIYLSNTDSNIVSQNNISRAGKTTVTTFYGVFVTGGIGNLIERNRIHNTHDAASSLTGAVYAIYHSSANSTSNKPSVVYNNLIYNINCTGTVYALYNSASSGVYYLYNTISLDDVAATAGTTRGLYQITTATDIIVVNNIFSITRGGTGIKYGMYFGTSTTTFTSDNNIIYKNSAGTGSQYVGYWNATNYTSFNDWQAANFGAFDQSSDSASPQFTNLLTADFTPQSITGNNIGFAIPEIPFDFYGALRDSFTPDPGAIEYSIIPLNDSCHNAIPVTAGTTVGGTIDATVDNVPTCLVGNNSTGGVWYKYTGLGDFVSLSLCNSTFDTRVRVFTGTCGALVCETGNDDSCSTQSQVGWCSVDSTDYYILIYGNAGQEGIFTMEITESPVSVPSISAMPDTVFCTGDSIVLQSSASASYLWNDPSSTTSRELVVFAAGSYMVTATDSNGCTQSSESQTVVENPLPVVSLGNDTSICPLDNITLDAGSGSSFLWSTGAISQTINYAGFNGDTTISVVVTDTNGCTGEDDINITEKPAPVVMLGNDTTICHNAEITLNAGAGGSSYSWSTGATTQTITYSGSNGNATIAVVVTGGNGCTGEDDIIINVDICGGVGEIDQKDMFNVYPNPNDGVFTISFTEPTSERLTLNLMNMQGKLVYSEVFYMNSDTHKAIDLRNQAKGVYTIMLQGTTFIQTEKLIIR